MRRLPTVKGAAAEGNGETDTVGVELEVGVLDGVAVMERVAEGVGGLVAEELTDAVTDVDADVEGVAVGVLEGVWLGDGEPVRVSDADAPPESVDVPVGV